MPDLSSIDIKYLTGVGPKKAELLKKEIGIYSLEDLLYYFPYKYIDRSHTYRVSEITGIMPYIQLRGKIICYEAAGEGRNRRLTAQFTDGTGFIELVWFKGIRFIPEKYTIGREYVLFGKPTPFGNKLNIAHPEIETPDASPISQGAGLQAYYSTTEKMKGQFIHSAALLKMVANLWNNLPGPVQETLPPRLLDELHLMPVQEALRQIHFPASPDRLRQAQYRLKFEELFYLQLNILRYTKQRQIKLGGFVFRHIGHYFNDFYNQCLPFELTNAQKRVIREIRADVGSGRQMNRLLQGDVGSGKTLVALMSILMAIDNGFQACLMAPTEILANQHFDGISEMVGRIGIRVELLTGSTRKKERERIHAGLQNGQVHLTIGTHALIENNVLFKNLGLVVIDEQHRFGVEQRSRLWRKNDRPPHVLVMTATPIPRTLAMTVYGDLEVSVIDELPPGRKPIQTLHQYENRRKGIYDSVLKQLETGRQVYFVYPLIQESEKIDLKNLEEGYEQVKEAFPDYRVCMVHGKMKAAEKEAEMQRFVTGEARIMVATTVIEVGVNVPNASVMVIENAERFGLAQLHQLRGRVGRGAEQSYCVLVTSPKLAEDTRKRLEILVRSNDGFEISEADLQLRGPGDLEGTLQSGVAFNLRIANLAKDGMILQQARDVAWRVLEADPALQLPENRLLQTQLQKLFKRKVDWSLIS